MRVSCAPYAAAVAILSLLTGSWPASASAASPEIRGTWITTTSSDDWSSSNLPGTMSSLKQVGLNTVYVEAWKNGYTNYNSTTLSTFTGTTSLNPSLGSRVLLNETRTAAANAGMIHGAWFEYGAMAQYLGNTGTATSSFNPLARKCRDSTWTVGTTSGTGWLLKDSSGNYTTASNGFLWMNPLVPEVRNLIKGIVVDAIEQFDLQIVQFDDHLAWPVQFGWDDYTKAVYKQETNRNLPASSTDANFLAWRQGKTQAFFAEIAAAAKAAKPSVVVSLAPSTASFSAANYCADWPKWMASSDEVLPQVYRSTYSSFATDWAAQITASGTSRAELGAGLRLLGTGSSTPWNELKQQIDKTRTDNALGHSIWYSEGISNSGTSNASNYRTQLTAYYDVATNGPAANPHFQTVRWSGTGGTGGSGTWSPLAATWKDISTIWVQDALGIFDGSGGAVTVSGTVGVAGGLDFRTTGYTVSGGTIALRGYTRAANAITVASGVTATIASTLTGSTGLTKSGTGVLALAGTGTGLTGGVAINAGMLTIGAGGTTGLLAAANAITVASGGTIGFNRTDAYGGEFTNAISGSGAVRLLAGSLTLSASQSFTGATVVSAGTLSASAAALQSTSSIAVDGGVLAAVGYNPSATLSVAAGGSATISGTGLSLAAVTNAAAAGRGIRFTAASGTTTLASLSGTGATSFASHARITGGIGSGSVSVTSGLTASISGGSVTAGSLTSGTISGGSVVVSGSATIGRVAGGTTTIGGLATIGTIASGTVRLGGSTGAVGTLASGTVRLGGSTGTVGTLAGGLLDVGDGSITVASGPFAAGVVTAIVAGRADGSWTGTSGITSSAAASDVAASMPRAVGWLDNGDGSVTAAYAAPGDTNLDQLVDILDAGNFLTLGMFDTALPATWFEGDFNYDYQVDILDASEFFGTGLYDTGNYNAAAGSVAAVPEPTMPVAIILAIAAHAAIAAARRRYA